MSIQEQPVRYDLPEQKSSSSIVINRGNEEYDPFANDDDEGENEQSTDTKHQKQESIRSTNGTMSRRVIIITNSSSNSDKLPSVQTNEQQSRRRSKSPIEHHRKHSDRRSRSPHHRNHQLSDRKRLRTSSPDTSIATTVNNNESLHSEIISASKPNKTSRNDNRKDSKYPSRHRSPPSSLSLNMSATSNNNRRLSSSKDEKLFDSSDNNSNRRSSKRDDYHAYRYDSSRNHHSYSASKYPSRDYSSSLHQPYNDRRTINSKPSNASRTLASIITSDGNGSYPSVKSNNHQISTDHRKRFYKHRKHLSYSNKSNLPISHSKNTFHAPLAFTQPSSRSQFSSSNFSRKSFSKRKPRFTQTSTQTEPDSVRLSSVPSVSIKNDTINTNGSSKSIEPLKTNGSRADDMLTEEMLLEEEKTQSPVKSIDLDSLTIPETTAKKTDIQELPINITTTATTLASSPTTTTTTTMTTAPMTPVPSLTPSPTKKPYTLYKVPHTNHTTPPLSSRHKKSMKKESSTTQSDSTTNKPSTKDNSCRTPLDERISNLLGVPTVSSSKPTNISTEQQLDVPSNSLVQTTSTPSDKSTESPQDVTLLISTMVKKSHEHSSLLKKLTTNDERRSAASKNYTSEWLASQKPEEAQTDEFIAPPSLIVLPTLVSSQSSNANSGKTSMLGKLSEAMSKLIQKNSDTTALTTNEAVEEAVPISAKHLERMERRKQREKRQSEIVAIAKEALKPAFKKHDITKDEYKAIMKKVVTKATHANEVDRVRISKMIDAYVKKYRTVHQRSSSTISTITNGSGV